MSGLFRVTPNLIESANVLGYHRSRPGRRVVAHAQVNGEPVVFIGHGLGTKRERWEYAATALDGFLTAAEPGMVSGRNVQGPLERETVAAFRKRHGYELPAVAP